jgi:hypothetical protein
MTLGGGNLAMKRIFGLGVVTIGLVTSLVLGAPPATAAQGELAGTWTSIDTDGSNQTLNITWSGKGAYAVAYFDEAAGTLCGGAPAMANGSGRVDGNTLFTRGAAVCLPGGNLLHGVIGIDYTYDAASDTLTDNFGVVWSRA